MTIEFNPLTFIEEIRKKNTVICPDCKKGHIITPYNPETSHFFHCTECTFKVNIN